MLNSFEFIGEKIIDNTIEQTPVQIEIVSRVVSDIEVISAVSSWNTHPPSSYFKECFSIKC